MASRTGIALLFRANRIGKQLGRSNMRARIPAINYCLTPRAQFYGTEKVADSARQQQVVDNQANPDELNNMIVKLQADIDVLKKDVQTLKEKNEELIDKYKRALADSENMRVRLTKQIEDAKVYGIQSFCKDLLEVADTLGSATDAVPKDKVEENPHLKNLYEGLNMTMACLLQVFKRHGLEQVNPVKQKFDPNFHEALFQKPDANETPNTVVEVTKLGYTLHGRVIRPALVGVSKAP